MDVHLKLHQNMKKLQSCSLIIFYDLRCIDVRDWKHDSKILPRERDKKHPESTLGAVEYI